MARIPTSLPGIRGLYAFRPATGGPLKLLSDALLKGQSPLTQGERELIATYVSSLNECDFCQVRHGARAAAQLGETEDAIACVAADYAAADISDKMKALLTVAGRIQQGGKHLGDDDVRAARLRGASDIEIHDTVLIAAAFCMYNRYIDGLRAGDET